MTIPASTIVSVIPGVIQAGGNPLALNGLILSQNAALPVGAPVSFPTLASVQAYFGDYQTIFAATTTSSSASINVTAMTTGLLAVGQEIQGPGIPPGTYILALGTGTGGVGTYTLSQEATAAETGATFYSYCLESTMAATYFAGYNNSTIKPNALLFTRYPGTAIGAFARGGSVAGVTAAQISAIAGAGALSVTIDGSVKSSSAINLGSAVSGSTINWSTVASLLVTALSLSAGQIAYSSLFNALVVYSETMGTGSTITAGTGNVAALLGLTTGAVTLSQGSAGLTTGSFMANLITYTQNWAVFTTAFEPVLADKEAFAEWTSSTNGQFVYAPYSSSYTDGFPAYCASNSYNGIFPTYVNPTDDPGASGAAFPLGFAASINWNGTGGYAAISFKSGLVPVSVSDPVTYANALAAGYNFYGVWATANDTFTWFYNGQIISPYNFLDAYLGAIWLNNQLQLQLMTTLASFNTIPYTNAGYAIIEAACTGQGSPVQQGLLNGLITPGVSLSGTQIAEVNNAAGLAIDSVLSTKGFYFQVLPATAEQRANRNSPACTLWYVNGGSVNQINLASVAIL